MTFRSPSEIKNVDHLPSGMSSRLSIVDVDMSVDLKVAKVIIACTSLNTYMHSKIATGLRLHRGKRRGEERGAEMAVRE